MNPTPSSAKGNYGQVIRLLSPAKAGEEILDCPCGTGALTKQLLERGYKVVTGDYCPDLFKLPGQTPAVFTDLNGKLPFGDERFATVVCCDGLGDLENVYNAVREFGRVLKPGGQLIVAIPNILNIRSRLRFLSYGFYNKFKGPYDEITGLGTKRPIPFWELRYALHTQGFQIATVRHNRIKSADWLLAPLIPIIWLLSLILMVRQNAQDKGSPVIRRQVIRQILHPRLLLGESLIVSAIRSRPASHSERISP